MDSTSGVRARTTVEVELHSPLGHFTAGEKAAELRDHLQGHIENLLEDLRIPAAAVLTLIRSDAGAVYPGVSYQLTLNGHRCRLELQSSGPLASTPSRLARVIADELCRNRKLLLTPSMAERIRRVWAERGIASAALPPAAFHTLLSLLLERGSHIDRAKSMTASTDDEHDARHYRRTLEALVSRSSDATGIGVLLSSAGHATLCGSAATSLSRGDTWSLQDQLEGLTDGLFADPGLLVPSPAIGSDHRLGGAEFRLQLNDLRWPPVDGLRPNEWLVHAPPEELNRLGIPAMGATHPLDGDACARVEGDDELLKKCREAGSILGPARLIADSLRAMARGNAAHLLTTEVVSCLLDVLQETHPALVEATASRFDPTVLTWILRDLVGEEVSIRDLRNLLEGLLSLEGPRSSAAALVASRTPLDVAYWSDWVRAELKRQISHRHLGEGRRAALYLVAADLEARMAATDRQPLPDGDRQRLLQSVLDAQKSHVARRVVILTTMAARKKLRRLIEQEFPGVAVIAYNEVSLDTNLVPCGRIGDR